MTIPFETIYPSDTRKELMKRILEYDFSDDSVEGIEAGTTTFLSQNFPNPAKSETSIVYGFENPCQYRLELYNGSGAMVMLLGEGYADAGRHKTVVDVAGLPAGMYFYRLIADGAVLIKKMIVK